MSFAPRTGSCHLLCIVYQISTHINGLAVMGEDDLSRDQ